MSMFKKNGISQRLAPVLATLLLCLGTCYLKAQTTTGSVTGTITDPTGAIVPSARVVITNTGTGDKRTVTADSKGIYLIGNLIPGQYREDVEVTGFKHYIREPITVEVEAALRIDVPMEVGATSESVTVSTEAPLLQSESAALSQVVNAKTVIEMPLNGRNVANLIALTPGVVAQGGTAGSPGSNQSAGHTNLAGFNNYQIGGAQPGQAASFIDGVPINQLGGNAVALLITQDAVDEFRVSSSGASAEFGRFGGGVINYATKTGANAFHGSAYEYFRNRALNASGYFAKRSTAPKPAYNQNQYGGTFGGPIKKDKLFFFASYEQFKLLTGSTVTALIPTLAERTGNFAADNPIYDPFSTVVTNGVVTRTQFLNNMIPASRFDAAGKAILQTYYPAPNVTGQSYNYTTTVEPGAVSKQATGRGDYNISDKQHAFIRYTYWDLNDIPLNMFQNLTGGAGSDQITHEGVIGDTYSLSAKTTLDLRLSVTRGFADDRPINTQTNLSQFGPAYATLQSQVTVALPIAPMISGLVALNGLTANSSQTRNTYALAPSISRIFGSHSVKAGADLRLLQFNYLSATNPTGQYAFDSGFTSANNSTSGATGNAIASTLLGTPSSGNIGTAAEVGQFSYYQGYYVTDTWQATRKLTVSAGLRYEVPGAWSERKNQATVLLPGLANTLSGGQNVTGGLALVNSSAYGPRNTEQAKYDLFAPRLGVVFSPVERTVLRVGYAITYLPFDAYDGGSPFISPINSATTNMVTSVGGAGQIPLNTLSDPFPAGGVTGAIQQSILEPVGRNQAYVDSLRGLSITGAVPTHRIGYDQQWNSSLQQQFPGDTVFQLAYAGNRGTFLPLGTSFQTGSINNLNQLPDQYDSLGAALVNKVTNPYAGSLNASGSLNGATVNAGQLLRPFPQYQNVLQSNSTGDSIYHSLQTSFLKRFRSGGVINSNYTWSKNIGNVSGTTLQQLETQGATPGVIQDFTNLRGERSELNYSVRNRFITSFVSDLPFGKGHYFLPNASGIMGGFVSGWGVNGIITLQTGYLLSLQAQNNQLSNVFGAGTIRPNYNPALPGCNGIKTISGSSQSRLNQWFNTSCFSAPGSYAFGNEPRVDASLHAPGIANYDFSIKKDTSIREGLKLDLRAEVFNLFNRVQFSTPATTLGVASFGTVTNTQNRSRNIQLSGRIEF